jgi:hypothetical protein
VTSFSFPLYQRRDPPVSDAAAVPDSEPLRASVRQVVRQQYIGRLAGIRKRQYARCVSDEGTAALQEHGGMVAPLDSGFSAGSP